MNCRKKIFISWIGCLVLILFGAAKAQDWNNLTLEECTKYAVQNNPKVQASFYKFEAAMEAVTRVSGLPDPVVSFGVFVSPVETRVGPQQAKISLMQMFPWFGTLGAKSKVQTSQAELAYQEFLENQLEVELELKQTYFLMAQTEAFKTLEYENLGILNSFKKLTTGRLKNAQGSMSDVIRTGILYDQSVLDHKKYALQIELLVLQLKKIMNVADTIPFNISAELPPIQGTPIDATDSTLKEHPSIKKWTLKMDQSEANKVLIKKQGLPQLGLGLDYMIIGKRNDVSVPDNGKNAFMPMMSMSLPIFRKKYKTRMKENEQMKKSFEKSRNEARNNLFFELQKAQVQQQMSWLELETNQEQIDKTRQTMKLLLSAYSNGAVAFDEVLRTNQGLLNLKRARIKAITDKQMAKIEIESLTSNPMDYEK